MARISIPFLDWRRLGVKVLSYGEENQNSHLTSLWCRVIGVWTLGKDDFPKKWGIHWPPKPLASSIVVDKNKKRNPAQTNKNTVNPNLDLKVYYKRLFQKTSLRMN